MNEHIDHTVGFGEPGSGKSLTSARDVCDHPGPAIVEDPHEQSQGRKVSEQTDAENLWLDRLKERRGLPYGLLSQSRSQNPDIRRREHMERATVFTEVMAADGSGSMVTTPLREEHTLNSILTFLEQDPPKDPRELNPIYAVRPGTDQYRALVRDCRDEELRYKVGRLARLSERALRGEVGSAERALSRTFRDEGFLDRCREGNLEAFFQNPRGRLVVEGGGAPRAMKQLVYRGLNLLTVAYVERRPVPWPPILIGIDECKAVGVGDWEEQQAAETRKRGLYWRFLWQFIPSERKGLLQVCQRKEAYRSSYEVARQMAPYFLRGRGGEESRAAKIEEITEEITELDPGERLVADRKGVRREYVPLMENPWPDWPGLREAKFQEKLCRVFTRTASRSTAAPSSPPGSGSATPPPTSSPDDSSPASRLKRRRGGSPPVGGSGKT
jgi:hypothetical protein